MTDEKHVPTDREYAAKFLRQEVSVRVRRLRDLADRLELEAEQAIQRAEAGKTPFANVPAGFIHELMTALFNLNVDSMITTAADGDRASE